VAGAMIQAASFPSEAPSWRIGFTFPSRELTALRLVTTGRGQALWRIHEARIFEGGRALAGWTAAARPYPWTAGFAHDGNLITFWRSSEWLTPGQSFEMDFGRAVAAGSVTIETSLDQRDVALKLEGRDASGAWRLLSDRPEAHEAPEMPDLRRAAIEQLKIRGIGYLLSFENEGETRDLRERPGLWGIREVAHNKDARLYQIP
jgi:hypothetical protein